MAMIISSFSQRSLLGSKGRADDFESGSLGGKTTPKRLETMEMRVAVMFDLVERWESNFVLVIVPLIMSNNIQ
jgi:hypothetical protein